MEPKLIQLLPLVVELSSNPDRIISALGLNFNPDAELERLHQSKKMLPSGQNPAVDYSASASKSMVTQDEVCTGVEEDRSARI